MPDIQDLDVTVPALTGAVPLHVHEHFLNLKKRVEKKAETKRDRAADALRALDDLYEGVEGVFEALSDIPPNPCPDVLGNTASALKTSLEGLIHEHAEEVVRFLPGAAAHVIAFRTAVDLSVQEKLLALVPGRREAHAR
jgi:hypothetical protein